MPGMQVAVTMLSKFTTLVGTQMVPTQPMQVSPYSSVTLDLFTGPFIGTSTPSATFTLQESNDGEQFVTCGGSFASITLAVAAEYQLSAPLTMGWLRLLIAVNGVNPGVTCWASGFLERRER